MSKTYTQIIPASDTFDGWLSKTNSILNDLTNVIITTNGDGSSGVTVGNAHINGIVSATTLRAATISGGNTINGDNLIVASNTTFNGQATFANTIIGSITGAANTATRFLNPVVITLGGDLSGNTVLVGNTNISIIGSANTSGNILTKSGNLSGLANTTASRLAIGLGSVATRDVSLNADFTVLPDAIPVRSTILTMTNTLIAQLLRPMTLDTIGDLVGSVSFTAANTTPVLSLTTNTSGNILTKSGNLSGLANTIISRTNLGLDISTNTNFNIDGGFIPTRATILNSIGSGTISEQSAFNNHPTFSIPINVNTIEVMINDVVTNGAAMGIQIGNIFGFSSTGYKGVWSTLDGGYVGALIMSSEFTIWVSAGNQANGVVYLKRIPNSNVWLVNYSIARSVGSPPKISFGSGKKELSGEPLSQVRLIGPGGIASNMTGGAVSVRWSR